MTNPLRELAAAGQAIWLDFIERKILKNGEFKRLIDEDALTGVTSNPSIFEKAIGESDAYDGQIADLLAEGDADPAALFDALAVQDIRDAADQLRATWDRLQGADGYVSLEVSPYLAHGSDQTVAEARRLWQAVDRPNLMIKVPGTKAGVPAIRQLIGEGINVNVTLLFGVDAYLAVADAHMSGLEALAARGGDPSKVAGVASFFVSRIDAQIDKAIDEKLKASAGADAKALQAMRGQVAIANAKDAYQRYLELIASPRWQALAAKGARPQRLLWASTGTKDPAYSDVLYIETLIGADTVNTMPPKTMDAFREHGRVTASLTADIEGARRILAEAEGLGLDLNGVTTRLVEDGVNQFADAADKLYATVAQKRARILGDRLNAQHVSLSADIQDAAQTAMETARKEGWSRRLWAKDPALWTGADEGEWLGWLAAAEGRAVDLAALEAFQNEVAEAGFIHAVVLGMGGSSLAPEVFAETFGVRQGHPKLMVLDSTDPAQIARVESQIDPARTLFIVSSKSGSTLEPNILHAYFHAAVAKAIGDNAVGAHFVAVTDPGSSLEKTALGQGFRRIFHGDPQIGGRYSALSNFGLVPAAVIGLDVRAFLESAEVMTRSCGPASPPLANPGVELGAVLGAAAKAGRDKLTFITSPGLADIGAWLEQLVAESTGKQGKGIIPIDGEPPAKPEAYGKDRIFAYLRLNGRDDPGHDEPVRALENAGLPVIRIDVGSRDSLGQEFVRWEVATAIAGAAIGINPFDQPDVEASKQKTRALTDAYEKSGRWPSETPLAEHDGLTLYADAKNASDLDAAGADGAFEALLGAHFKRAGTGDYIALLAYADRSPEAIEILRRLRVRLRDHTHAATAVGFGPRFLHSTGQAYKGGPNSGVFLQITHDAGADIAVPGHGYSFGVVEQAQGRGDFEVLSERERRLIRVHLGTNVEDGLKRLAKAIDQALI